MAEMGDSCTKEAILPVLLSIPILYTADDDKAYENWVLFGIDLGLQGERLIEIKETAMTKGSDSLSGVVTELIAEWFRKKTRTGERASTTELVEALRENDLEVFADAIQTAFWNSTLPRPASSISSMDSSVITLSQQQGLSSSSGSSVASSVVSQQEVYPFHKKEFTAGFRESSGNDFYSAELKDEDWREWRDYFVQPTPTVKQEEGASLSAFREAVKENRRDDIIKLIQDGVVNINELTKDKHRSSALLHFVAWSIPNRDDAIEIIKLLIHAGAALDIMNPSTNSPFTDGLLATGGTHNLPKLKWKQFDQFVRCLIETGNEKFLVTPYGRNQACVLHWAMKKAILGRPTIGFLHTSNVNLNFLSNTGDSLLCYAIQGNRSAEAIHYLVQLGANWRLRNKFNNNNLLHVAVKSMNGTAFKYFLNLDPNLALEKANDGFSPNDLLKMRSGDWKMDAKAAAMLELVGKIK